MNKAPQAGDAEEDDETRTATNVCPELRLSGTLHLHALETPDYTLSNLNAAWREAKNALTQEGGNETLFLLSAELFPMHFISHSPDIFKPLMVNEFTTFKMTITWMLKQRDPTDFVVVADGRSECARKAIRNVFEDELENDFLELWVVYEGEASLRRDSRNPKRKVAWSGNDNEVLFMSLPSATRGKRKLVNRESFMQCGESTNYSRSYTGVQNRTLENIPRLTAEDKAAILGHSAVGCFQRERVQNDVDSNGHPLFWCEWKPISLYTALFRDCDVTNVVDLSIGSGAAADGALYNNCNYFGVCFNDKHMDWVRSLLQQ